MIQATVIMIAIAALLLAYAWRLGEGRHIRGIRSGAATLKRTLPMLVIAFIIVGYVSVLSPQVLVRTWIGPDSGGRGLLIGAGAGMLLPGGPYVIFPLIATLYQAGAGIGPTLAMITAWASLALLNVTFELPFLGWRFTLVRFAIGLLIPPLVGLLASALF
jgi:uncharacterized membrane protein YraQ (UPF0718 family)